MLNSLKASDELRLPGGVRVVKDRSGQVRISTATTQRMVAPENTESAITLALSARELQDEVDVLADKINDIPREDWEEFEVPGGKVMVSRAAADPDGWEFELDGRTNLTNHDAAEIIARRRQQPDAPKSPGVQDLPMGRLTAIDPFTFTAAGVKHDLPSGAELDVLRKSGVGWIVRSPDKSGIGLINKGEARVSYSAIWPPLKKSLGAPEAVDITVGGKVTHVRGGWKPHHNWDPPPPGTPARWFDENDGHQVYGLVDEWDPDPPGALWVVAEDGTRHRNPDDLEVSGEWPVDDEWVHVLRSRTARQK